MPKGVGFVFLASVLSSAAYSQTTPGQPAFAVASLKRATSKDLFATMTENNGTVRYTSTLAGIIQRAYGLEPYRLLGGPAWLRSEYYELAANLPAGSSKEQIPAMLRQLLVERVHLSVRSESRETPVYGLIVGNGGMKLKQVPASSEQAPNARQDTPRSSGVTAVNPATGRIHVESTMTMAKLVNLLSPNMDRRVLDMTQVPGEYDIQLDARLPASSSLPFPGAAPSTDEPPKDWILPNGKKLPGDAPSIFSEIQKLGLKLDPRRALIEYVIVDKVDMDPTEN
jgi:uncharacterized protein (TIGR03435 family)